MLDQQATIDVLTERIEVERAIGYYANHHVHDAHVLNRSSDNIPATTGSASFQLLASMQSPQFTTTTPQQQLSAVPTADRQNQPRTYLKHSNIGIMHSSTPTFLINSDNLVNSAEHAMHADDHDLSQEITPLNIPVPPTMTTADESLPPLASIPSPVPFPVIPLPDESFSVEIDEPGLFGGEHCTSPGEEERNALLSPNEPDDLDTENSIVQRTGMRMAWNKRPTSMTGLDLNLEDTLD